MQDRTKMKGGFKIGTALGAYIVLLVMEAELLL